MDIKVLHKPGNRYRPLRIDHGLCNNVSSAFNRLQELKDKGYGGVVSNVAFNNYLQDEKNMCFFKDTVIKAKEEGLRVWIYDENGYPSGSAGGLTLKANAEYEAKAVAVIFKKVHKGDIINIEAIYGHNFLCAYALPIDFNVCECTYTDLHSKPEDVLIDAINGAIVNLDKYIDKLYNLNYQADRDSLVCYYASKYLYEGTHAQHNVSASRRYISVISKDAINEFLNNTYKKYTDSVGHLYSTVIEAFFTDEPSFMTGYLNKGLYPNNVDDEYDESIPLLPIIPWEPFIPKEFSEKYGYNLMDNLHYLFAGTNRRAQQVRYDFLSLMSDMYYDSFFKQIGDYCEDNNINFSGHVLLEESILHHAVYEGNVFKLIGKMGYPGIDMLSTIPEEIMTFAATPKLISSSAKYHKRAHVMTETSGHNQSARNTAFGIKEMLGSAGLQFALGIDTFTSYYDDNAISIDDNNLYCTYIARICEMFDGGINNVNVAIYYPIESAWIATKGSDKQLYQREYGVGASNMEQSWLSIIDLLLKNQIEFDCLDTDALYDLSTDNCIYDFIVIPKILVLPDKLNESLKNFAQQRKYIVFDSFSDLVKESINKLSKLNNVIVTNNVNDIPFVIKSRMKNELEIVGSNSIIIRSSDNVNFGFKKVYILVNSSVDTVTFDVVLETNDSVKCYNPVDNTLTGCNLVKTDSTHVKFSIAIDGYMSKIVCIG